MTNKQVLLAAACGAAAFGGLQAAGFSGDAQAKIPGTGFSVNAEIVKYLLSLAAMFLPALADKLRPGLGNIIAKIIDFFSDFFSGLGTKDQPVVAPIPIPSPKPETHAPCLCDDMDHLADIARRLKDDPAAQANVTKIANDLFVSHTKGKPDAKKPE